MLDIKFIRENPQKVKVGAEKKGIKIDIDELLKVDQKRLDVLQKLEIQRSEQNKITDQVAESKDKTKKEELINKAQKMREDGKDLESELKEVSNEFDILMRKIPNPPFEEVPVGKDDSDNRVLKKVGEPTKFDFEPKDHLALGEALDIIDTKRAAKISGSRFGILKNEAALMEFALVQYGLETLKKEGFVLVIPPVMLKTEMMDGMGYVERGKDEIYYLEKDDLFLVGTSEQMIGPMHSGEVFERKDLSKRYVGFSSCFRREAGSYGKDTKGILRVHQFDKLEMFSFCEPENSSAEHELMLSVEEKLMQGLKLPYQVIDICTGDLGDPAAKKYDIEAWLPGQNNYRETHSTSNCTDFQARRLDIKFKNKEGKLEYVHMLNGTALAIGRIIIAILENYQQKDGSIVIPDVLQKYMGMKKISR
ncbi:MAG: serine--tRNA ligase [Patescibacteria group bacterium]